MYRIMYKQKTNYLSDMIETRGRKPKYDFTALLKGNAEFEFTPSIRVSIMTYAKKNGFKVKTRKIGEKLMVYREGQA